MHFKFVHVFATHNMYYSVFGCVIVLNAVTTCTLLFFAVSHILLLSFVKQTIVQPALTGMINMIA